MWIIDDSGPKDEVIERVEALTYDSFLKDASERLELALAEVKVAKSQGKAVVADRLALAQQLVDDLHGVGEREEFEAAKSYALGVLERCETSHVGVCVRFFDNPREAPSGWTLSVSVSGFNGE